MFPGVLLLFSDWFVLITFVCSSLKKMYKKVFNNLIRGVPVEECCISWRESRPQKQRHLASIVANKRNIIDTCFAIKTVSYTHLRAHETEADLVCRLLLEKKKCLIASLLKCSWISKGNQNPADFHRGPCFFRGKSTKHFLEDNYKASGYILYNNLIRGVSIEECCISWRESRPQSRDI